jgi:hypothetical protein
MVGHAGVDPLRVCIKVVDCCDSSSVGTLTCVRSLETCVEIALATVPDRLAIADCFFYFGEDG